MDLRKKIIGWLLKPDETITKNVETDAPATNDAPLTNNAPLRNNAPVTIQNKPKKRRIAPIIYGNNVKEGVIKQRDNGYYAYWYDGHKPRQKKGKLEQLKKQLDKFQQEGCTLESWKKTSQSIKNSGSII